MVETDSGLSIIDGLQRTGHDEKADQRIFFRNPLYSAASRLKNLNTGERFEGLIKDISGSGMGLLLSRECFPGTVLEIALEIPDGFGTLKLLGKVVWSGEEPPFGFRAGVCVLNPRFMAVSRILKLFL